MYVVTLFELNLPQSESGSARYARSTTAYGPLSEFRGGRPCFNLHLLFEAIFQRVFKLPRWQRLGFVLQVLTRGSTPFHKKCTTVLPHLDLEMHEFLKKDLAAVEILKTWSWSRAGSQAFEGNHPKGLSSAPFVTFCL